MELDDRPDRMQERQELPHEFRNQRLKHRSCGHPKGIPKRLSLSVIRSTTIVKSARREILRCHEGCRVRVAAVRGARDPDDGMKLRILDR